MTAKEYLRQARKLKVSIESKQECIRQMMELCGLKGRSFEEVRVSGGTRGSFSNMMDAMIDLTDEMHVEIAGLARLYQEIMKKIGAVDDMGQRTVLELYYLNGHTWEEVADLMNYSRRNVSYLHEKALATLEALFLVFPGEGEVR